MNAIKNKEFDCSSGNQLRDFLFIDDLVRALIKILKNKNTLGEIINIGSGKPVRVKKLILDICKLAKGGKPQFGRIPLRKDEIIKLYPNLSKINKLLNWRAKVSLGNGLKKTIKNFYKNKMKKLYLISNDKIWISKKLYFK